MEVLRNKAAESGTAVRSETRGSYETVNIGALKTWHRSPNYVTKGGRNKVRKYTSTYAPGACRITIAEIY